MEDSIVVSIREKGNEAFKYDDIQSAIKLYSDAIDVDENDGKSFTNRSICYARLNEWDRSASDALVAVQLSPESIKAYHRLITALLKLYRIVEGNHHLTYAFRQFGVIQELLYLQQESMTASYARNYAQFLDFDMLKTLTEFPRCPDLFHLTTGISDIDRNHSLMIFVSHCWLRPKEGCEGWNGKPHPDNAQHSKFELCVAGIDLLWKRHAKRMKKCYVWLDYGCIDQDNRDKLAKSLKQYNKIVEICDVIFTPIVDLDYRLRRYVPSIESLSSYEAPLWGQGPNAYLNRAWCRMEMMYAAQLPVVKNTDEVQRHTLFTDGLSVQTRVNRRPQIIFGHRQLDDKFLYFTDTLQAAVFERYHPSTGHLSVESDRQHIQTLLNLLAPYTTKSVTQGEVGYTKPYHRRCSITNHMGDYYEGDLWFGMLHGDGVLVTSVGHEVVGDFRYGFPHGDGSIRYVDGNYYVGQLRWLKRHGFGTLYLTNGDIYEGRFKNNLYHSRGTYIHCNGDIRVDYYRKGKISDKFWQLYDIADNVFYFVKIVNVLTLYRARGIRLLLRLTIFVLVNTRSIFSFINYSIPFMRRYVYICREMATKQQLRKNLAYT